VRRGSAVAVAALGLVLLLVGCSDDPDTPSTAPGSTTSGATAPAKPGAPVAAPRATAAPLPVLATRSGDNGWSLSITAVRRSGDRIVVEGVLDGSRSDQNLLGFTEPGFGTLKDASGQTTDPINGEFSGVSLTVPGDPTVYLPVRDDDNLCLCTRMSSNVFDREAIPVFVYLSAPSGATTVDVAVNAIGTFTGLKVTS
jgi:hypothetical protein